MNNSIFFRQTTSQTTSAVLKAMELRYVKVLYPEHVDTACAPMPISSNFNVSLPRSARCCGRKASETIGISSHKFHDVV